MATSAHVRNLETEKYAHVTFFFNGGVEKEYDNEDRHMIPSPKVATYDKQPEMSVQSVADKVAEVVKSDQYDFVMCNFAPPDMVGPLLTRLAVESEQILSGRPHRGVRCCSRSDRGHRQGSENGL